MPEPVRCAATIWPSSSDRWMRCPGVILSATGSCSVYSNQHDTANTKINLSANPQVAPVPASNSEAPMLTVTLSVRTEDPDEAQTISAALSSVFTTLVRNGATSASLSIWEGDDDEELVEVVAATGSPQQEQLPDLE